jgi:hypothetical protein
MLLAEGVKPPLQDDVYQVPVAPACRAARTMQNAQCAMQNADLVVLFMVVLRVAKSISRVV